MSEEELQLLITLDDPVGAPEEDIFNHLQTKNNVEYRPSQRLPAVSDNDRLKSQQSQLDD
jgi:hypothetical protein